MDKAIADYNAGIATAERKGFVEGEIKATIGHTPKKLFDYVQKISKAVEELEDFVNNYSSDSGNEGGEEEGEYQYFEKRGETRNAYT
ncbi:hypothetical protein FACS1894188_13460 [Clostridia bacterium]|nr:hypothetical protein FACS1894188_13460 [Clostridia bacterium]